MRLLKQLEEVMAEIRALKRKDEERELAYKQQLAADEAPHQGRHTQERRRRSFCSRIVKKKNVSPTHCGRWRN